jgi:hypothetical protein
MSTLWVWFVTCWCTHILYNTILPFKKKLASPSYSHHPNLIVILIALICASLTSLSSAPCHPLRPNLSFPHRTIIPVWTTPISPLLIMSTQSLHHPPPSFIVILPSLASPWHSDLVRRHPPRLRHHAVAPRTSATSLSPHHPMLAPQFSVPSYLCRCLPDLTFSSCVIFSIARTTHPDLARRRSRFAALCRHTTMSCHRSRLSDLIVMPTPPWPYSFSFAPASACTIAPWSPIPTHLPT